MSEIFRIKNTCNYGIDYIFKGQKMSENYTDRPLVEIDIGNAPKVYSTQAAIIKGVQSDGSSFKIDIGRVCYLDRKGDLLAFGQGKNSKINPVRIDSLSLKRVVLLRRYLDVILNQSARSESVRGKLFLTRKFFTFIDFNGGEKPVILTEFVREYKRYSIMLDQRGRMSGNSSLSQGYIYKLLKNARDFIQKAFDMTENETHTHLKTLRSSASGKPPSSTRVTLDEGSKYLRTCAMVFNNFADAILENNYPICVKPMDSVSDDLYWHRPGGGIVTINHLPNCFSNDGTPCAYENIKSIFLNNENLYNSMLINSRNSWRSKKIWSTKVYAFNLSVFCFYQIYLAVTAANIQPVLDLKVSDLDIDKIGSSSFAEKHKFRAGKKVYFTAPIQFKPEISKYLRLREWAKSKRISGGAKDFLFVQISEKNKLIRFNRNKSSSIIRKSILFSKVKRITSKDIRQLTSEFYIRKSKGNISLVAKKLNNTVAMVAKSYTAIDVDSQAQEMFLYYEELSARVKLFNRETEDVIPVMLANEVSSESVASGACANINATIPLRAKGFNSDAPEPACGTFESCLFCEHFAMHEDFEDIHKLLSLRDALHLTSLVRDDSEHHENVVKPSLERIDEIIGYLKTRCSEIGLLVLKVEDELSMGNYSKHWSKLIQVLIDRINVLDKNIDYE